MFTETVPALQVLVPLAQEIGLLVLLLFVLGVDLFSRPARRRSLGVFTGVGLLLVMALTLVVAAIFLPNPEYTGPVLGGMVHYDSLSVIFQTMVLLSGALTAFLSVDVPGVSREGEYYAILLVAIIGLNLMSAATNLIMVFLALETASISLYLLAGYLRDSTRSAEAGLKYYLFGAATSGLLLYGLSLLMGFTGTASLYDMPARLAEVFGGSPSGTFGVILALLLVLVGLGFKIAAVPFHFWTPDVYQGAPTPITAFVSTASKAASFALLVRLFAVVWPAEVLPYWTGLLAAIAVVTMSLGNLLALVQRNIKRMLAYSSIAQAGYTLIGVVALSEAGTGVAAVAFYMFMYVLTNLLAFTVIVQVSNATGSDDTVEFAGLSRRSPYLALAMVLAMLSLSGVPPLAGFFGKFFLFAAAVDAGYTWLALIGVVNSIVALYYYLTIVKYMYVDPPADTTVIASPTASRAVMWIAGLGVLVMGTLAGPWWGWALDAARSLVASLP